jgi:hypothetical protein
MAKVKIQGNASGIGILTVTAPNTSTDRTITLPDGTGTLIADDGSGNVVLEGNVLIGEDSGDAFNADSMLRLQRTGDRVYMQFKTDADQESGILFGDVDDDVECAIKYEPANKALTFSTGNNAEAMRILSSGGITFNGDTSSDNALDDFETGNWTPVFKGSGTTGSYTYSEQHGKYIKIGNQVTIWVALFNITQSSAGSGTIQIDGLPFTVSSSTHRGAVGTLELDSFTFSGSLSATVESSKTYIVLRDSRSGNTDQALQVSSRNSDSSDMCICITYIAA